MNISQFWQKYYVMEKQEENISISVKEEEKASVEENTIKEKNTCDHFFQFNDLSAIFVFAFVGRRNKLAMDQEGEEKKLRF